MSKARKISLLQKLKCLHFTYKSGENASTNPICGSIFIFTSCRTAYQSKLDQIDKMSFPLLYRFFPIGCSGAVMMVPSPCPPKGKNVPWWTFSEKSGAHDMITVGRAASVFSPARVLCDPAGTFQFP